MKYIDQIPYGIMFVWAVQDEFISTRPVGFATGKNVSIFFPKDGYCSMEKNIPTPYLDILHTSTRIEGQMRSFSHLPFFALSLSHLISIEQLPLGRWPKMRKKIQKIDLGLWKLSGVPGTSVSFTVEVRFLGGWWVDKQFHWQIYMLHNPTH